MGSLLSEMNEYESRTTVPISEFEPSRSEKSFSFEKKPALNAHIAISALKQPYFAFRNVVRNRRIQCFCHLDLVFFTEIDGILDFLRFRHRVHFRSMQRDLRG